MSAPVSGGPLTRLYRNRIGQPDTSDEVWGYAVFVGGVILGIVGIGMLITANLEGSVPQWPVVIVAVALVFLITGPLIRLPLQRRATWLVYVGALLSLAALPWFLIAYPGWRTQAPSIIGLYSIGVAVMALGGVFVPILTSSAERDAELSRQSEEIMELHQALDDADADEEDLTRLLEELRSGQADAEADEADLAARLRSLRQSQSRFELYGDREGQWRWRLRHRNGNVVAVGGEGYTRKHNAQKGMEAVRRDALGATVHLIEDEAELPAVDEPFEPIEEVESRADFEVFEDAAGRHRWRLRHDNGDIIADSSQGYASRGGVENAIRGIREYVGPANYLWPDPTAIEVYLDQAGQWRWRLVHQNGNILADSGEGYATRSGARRALERIRDGIDHMEFEVYEDNAGEYRWRLFGGNNQMMADSGEGYDARNGAEDSVERVREYMPAAHLLDIGRAAFEVYEDSAGEFRWRLRHRNGKIMADGGEGYSDRSGARDGIESVKRNATNADVEIATD